MILLIVLLQSIVKIQEALRAPLPTDCIYADNFNPPVYCGVKVFCKCANKFPSIDKDKSFGNCYSIPKILLPEKFPDDVENAAPFVVTESNESGEKALRGLEASEMVEDKEKKGTSMDRNGDIIDVLRGTRSSFYESGYDILFPKGNNSKFLQPEELDTSGCGVTFKEKGEEYLSLRLVDMGSLGRQFVPGNIVQILKIVDKRTNGECSFVNNPATNQKCTEADRKHTLYSIVVRMERRKLRQTVLNAIHEKYEGYWKKKPTNSTVDLCYGIRKNPNEILCLI